MILLFCCGIDEKQPCAAKSLVQGAIACLHATIFQMFAGGDTCERLENIILLG